MKILQTNLGRAKVSHDLAYATAMEMQVDLLIVAEPNIKITGKGKWCVNKKKTVAIYILNKKCGATEVQILDDVVIVKFENFKIIAGYISPNIPLKNFEKIANSMFETTVNRGEYKIILGDMNAKSPYWGSPATDARGEHWCECMAEEDIIAVNNGDPTFVRGNSVTHIDITCISRTFAHKIRNWQVLNDEIGSYHRPIYFEIDTGQEIQRRIPIQRFLNEEKFKRLVQEETENENIKNVTDLTKVIGKLTKDSTIECRGKADRYPYWWTAQISELRKECQRVRRTLLRKKRKDISAHADINDLTERSKSLTKKLKNLIINSKRKCWLELIKDLDEDIWGQGYSIVTKTLKDDTSPVELTDENRNFIIDHLFPDKVVEFKKNTTITDNVPDFTIEELREVARNIKTKKAPGPDEIPPKVVKIILDSCQDLVLKILNDLLRKQEFPNMWKVARVVLIKKQNKPQNVPSSYRPICLISCLAKVYEALVRNRIMKELEDGNKLSPKQFGFRKGRSTVHALDYIINAAKSDSTWVLMILLDIKNAFNSANWDRILEAMREKEISSYLINIIESYLDQRQIVTGKVKKDITAGVPQGSVLGPTLWLILYDGVLGRDLGPHTTPIAYADDLAIIVKAEKIDQLNYEANSALSRIEEWMRRQDLFLAVEKTEAIVLKGPRKRQDIHVTIGGSTIELSKTVKYLGVVLDNWGYFGPHVAYVVEKAERRFSMLARLMPNTVGPGYRGRRLLYGVCQSILLYAAPIWHNAMRVKKYKGMVMSIQRRALIRVAAAYRTISTAAVQVITGITPIHILIEEQKLIFDEGNGHKEEVRAAAREVSLQKWQQEWDENMETGQWTKRLIPILREWIACKFKTTNYYVTQFLSGHGSFGTYTYRIKKDENENCMYCGKVDTPQHTFFECDRWEANRQSLELSIGVKLDPDNIIGEMIKNKSSYGKITDHVVEIMKNKEREERERRQL
jgi:Reverse transcriptase (RNA-dependent DNA polymerase)/Endonuclease-reverse transcriptase